MNALRNWLTNHKFEAHLCAFLLLTLPPVGMYFAARNNHPNGVVYLLSFVVLGNLIAMLVP
jgi:uncharacterized integral membrane protein